MIGDTYPGTPTDFFESGDTGLSETAQRAPDDNTTHTVAPELDHLQDDSAELAGETELPTGPPSSDSLRSEDQGSTGGEDEVATRLGWNAGVQTIFPIPGVDSGGGHSADDGIERPNKGNKPLADEAATTETGSVAERSRIDQHEGVAQETEGDTSPAEAGEAHEAGPLPAYKIAGDLSPELRARMEDQVDFKREHPLYWLRIELGLGEPIEVLEPPEGRAEQIDAIRQATIDHVREHTGLDVSERVPGSDRVFLVASETMNEIDERQGKASHSVPTAGLAFGDLGIALYTEGSTPQTTLYRIQHEHAHTATETTVHVSLVDDLGLATAERTYGTGLSSQEPGSYALANEGFTDDIALGVVREQWNKHEVLRSFAALPPPSPGYDAEHNTVRYVQNLVARQHGGTREEVSDTMLSAAVCGDTQGFGTMLEEAFGTEGRQALAEWNTRFTTMGSSTSLPLEDKLYDLDRDQTNRRFYRDMRERRGR